MRKTGNQATRPRNLISFNAKLAENMRTALCLLGDTDATVAERMTSKVGPTYTTEWVSQRLSGVVVMTTNELVWLCSAADLDVVKLVELSLGQCDALWAGRSAAEAEAA